MPKAQCAPPTSNSRSTTSEYPTISFRPHPRSASSLRRNQACKQCRKRKSKCNAGRPCQACLRAHAVVVANLVKRGLPFDGVQPECCYDRDSDSQRSSPAQLTPSPVQSYDELPKPQSYAPAQPDSPYQELDVQTPPPMPISSPYWPMAPYLPAGSPDSSTHVLPPMYIPPDENIAMVERDSCYYLPSPYQQPPTLSRLWEGNLNELGSPWAEWGYHSPELDALSLFNSSEVLQLMWDGQLS